MENVTRPLALKIMILSYALLGVILTCVVIYSFYLFTSTGLADMSLLKLSFMKGIGLDYTNYSSHEMSVFVAEILPTLLTGYFCAIFLYFAKPSLFGIVFILDAIAFTSGFGYITKVIVFCMIYLPSTQSYFKTMKTLKEDPEKSV